MTTTTSAPALAFVLLHVSDFDAASRYYTETLGFTPVLEQSGPSFRMFVPAEGGATFAIIQAGADTAATGAVELYFYTNDLEGKRAEWQGRGAQVSEIETRPFGRLFTAPAPDGEPVYVMTPA